MYFYLVNKDISLTVLHSCDSDRHMMNERGILIGLILIDSLTDHTLVYHQGGKLFCVKHSQTFSRTCVELDEDFFLPLF